ncbi:hypothetical protein pb186bvf_020369 [Paramecium bursaria]
MNYYITQSSEDQNFMHLFKDSEVQYSIQLNYQVIEVVLLCETKILYFLEGVEQAFIYDLVKQFSQKAFFKYDDKCKYMMNMEMTKIAIYNNYKRSLSFYDISSKVSTKLNQTFRIVGCLNNQIIGIQKLQGLKISYDSCVSVFQLPKDKIKKTYKIKLLGNRLLFINKNKFYFLNINQRQGYEMKGLDIDIIKIGKSIYFMMTHCRGYFMFKNGSKLKIISSRRQPYINYQQKILSHTNRSVCMRIDGIINSLYIVSLVKPNFTVIVFDNNMTIATALQNWKLVATKNQILIWNENEIFFFDL